MAKDKNKSPYWHIEDQAWWKRYSAMVNGNLREYDEEHPRNNPEPQKEEKTYVSAPAGTAEAYQQTEMTTCVTPAQTEQVYWYATSGSYSGLSIIKGTTSGSYALSVWRGSRPTSGSGDGVMAYGLHLL